MYGVELDNRFITLDEREGGELINTPSTQEVRWCPQYVHLLRVPEHASEGINSFDLHFFVDLVNANTIEKNSLIRWCDCRECGR